MQRILFALPLLVAGCNSGVGSDSQGTTGGDSTGLKAGIYTGTISCQNTSLDSSGVLVESSDSQQLTVIISSSGLPIAGGQEVAQGSVSTDDVGGGLLEATVVITNVTVADNGVIVDSDVDLSVTACFDTCQFAFDGECDDGGPGAVTVACGFGTDCFDCGGASTVEFQGIRSRTYKLFGLDRIDYRSTTVIGEEFGTFFQSTECQGILVP